MNRLERMEEQLEQHSVDAFIVDDPVNLFYFTGLHLSSGQLFICGDRTHLFVDPRYLEVAQKGTQIPVSLKKDGALKAHVQGTPGVRKLSFDSSIISYSGYAQLWQDLDGCGAEFFAQDGILHQVRAVKGPDEVEKLKAAAELCTEGFDYAKGLLEEGVTEREIAQKLKIFWLERGAEGVSFEPIVSFGVNTSMIHYTPGDAKLEKGQPVLLDIGVTLNGYQSDMTRMVFFGDVDPKIQEIYRVVQKAVEAALEVCVPGSLAQTVDEAARGLIGQAGYGDKFPHSLGHGVGIEVHEAPVLRGTGPYAEMPLKTNMVLTIEPAIYLPGVGGVRLENTIRITEKGYETLTRRPL